MIRFKKRLLALALMAFATMTKTTNLQNKNSKLTSMKLGSQSSTLYLGSLSQNEQNHPIEFWIFYDGELIKTKNQEYIIKDRLLTRLYVIFTDPNNIKFETSEENNIKNLSCLTKNYHGYQLDLTQDDSYDPEIFMNTWEISSYELHGGIPLNSIIIPINPSLIEIQLENVSWRASNRAIKLPIVKIKNKNELGSLVKTVAEACLKCLNLRPFHAKQQTTTISRHKATQSVILAS